jgi:hypothetical protein
VIADDPNEGSNDDNESLEGIKVQMMTMKVWKVMKLTLPLIKMSNT